MECLWLVHLYILSINRPFAHFQLGSKIIYVFKHFYELFPFNLNKMVPFHAK